MKMPDVKMPDVDLPDVNLPDVKMPDVELADLSPSNLPHFNGIDVLILAAIIGMLYLGAKRGVVKELVGLGIVISAWILSNMSYLALESGYKSLTGTVATARVAAYGTTFLVFLLVLFLIFRIITNAVDVNEANNLFNRGMGSLLSVTKLTLVASIFFFILNALPDGPKVVGRSWFSVKLSFVSEPLGRKLISNLPQNEVVKKTGPDHTP